MLVVAAAAVADAPGKWIHHQRTVARETSTRTLDGTEYTFIVSYLASGQDRKVEKGNCGAFSCSLQCVLEARNVELLRRVYVQHPGEGIREISQKAWSKSFRSKLHEQSCANASSSGESKKFRSRMLGSWHATIAGDADAVSTVIDRYLPGSE